MAIRAVKLKTSLIVLLALIALVVSGCQAKEAAQDSEAPEPAAQQDVQGEEADPNAPPSAVAAYLKALGLPAEEMKWPEFVSSFEGPQETEEDLMARIKSGILVRGMITELDTARIPAGGEVWYVATAAVRVDEVLYGSAPDELRISAAGVWDSEEETAGAAAIPALEGCYAGTSGIFLIGTWDGASLWEINGISVDPRELGEYTLGGRFEQAGDSLVTRDRSISIPFDALGIEAPVTDESWDGVPFICASVQELVDTVRAERQSETKDPAARNVRLEELSVLYVPLADPDTYRLVQILVTPDCVFYYFTPAQQEDGGMENCFEIGVYRDPSVTMDQFCKRFETEPDADGFGYRADCGPIFFQQDDTVITVCGPEGMCDYDTLRSLCQMERIEIPEE